MPNRTDVPGLPMCSAGASALRGKRNEMAAPRQLGCAKITTNIFRGITIEPAASLYMFTSFVHISVFQALLYEKATLIVNKSLADSSANISHTDMLLQVQTLANHTYLLSTLCLLLPSLFIAGICGSLSDLKYKKRTLVLPFFGLLLADINYVVQAYFIEFSIYLLLISDLVFATFGGFTAILSGIFSYSARHDNREKNSCRIAVMEACIGFGGTLGFVLAGILHRSLSYWQIFALNLVLHVLILVYMLIRISSKTLYVDASSANGAVDSQKLSLHQQVWFHLKQLKHTLVRERPADGRKCITSGLVAFCFSYYLSNGAQHIMFFYFKHRYGWTITEYGFFRGVYYAVSSMIVLIAYPLLRRRGVSDLMLATWGIVARSIGCLVLGLAPTGSLACITLLFFSLNRFNATGLRCTLSAEVSLAEQGKIFAILAMLESLIGLLASLSFNSLFPLTLSFYSGFSYVLIGALFSVPFTFILLTMRTIRRRHRHS
uniref:Major facilitator superfamily (MFS) profile domain-containing protein n=1 Tax=Trichuris muris TaxID=70415 RepID=A0A5S6QBV2_TRIMR